MNLFDRESPLGRLLCALGDLIALNLIWLLGCLPLFTIGASTAALYSTARGLVEGSCASVLQTYWKAFREGFKKATAAFFILLVLGAVILADVFLLLRFPQAFPLWVKVLTAIPAVLVLVAAGYVFPLQAWFEHTIRGTLLNSLLMSLIHLPVSLVVSALDLLPVVLLLFFPYVFFKSLPVWILLGISLTALLNTLLLGRVFRRYFPKGEK